jgi:hypothetical protein
METKATIASERDACDIIKVLALLLSSTELVVLAGPFFLHLRHYYLSRK